MSFLMKTKVPITDLELFARICDKHQVTYKALDGTTNKVAELIDHAVYDRRFARTTAHVIKDGSGYVLHIDNDQNYCSLSHRLGKNGGKLIQDYTVTMLKSKLSRSGQMARVSRTLADGTIIMKVAVNA
jgi:hypothetical protein